MKVHDIMTRDPACVTPDATVREAAQVMKREDVGIVPVVDAQDSKTLVGVITDRDIAIRCVADGRDGTQRVRDCMSANKLATCRENDDVNRVMDAMRTEQVRRIPIVDERGSLVGIIAQADIVRKATNDARAEDTIEKISQPGGRHST
jgi:CBS domain-containing protein